MKSWYENTDVHMYSMLTVLNGSIDTEIISNKYKSNKSCFIIFFHFIKTVF